MQNKEKEASDVDILASLDQSDILLDQLTRQKQLDRACLLDIAERSLLRFIG